MKKLKRSKKWPWQLGTQMFTQSSFSRPTVNRKLWRCDNDIYVNFFYLSCCCDRHTSSNFRVLAFIEACVKVWILLRLAVNVFVMSAKSKTPRALCQRFCLTSSFQYLSVVKKFVSDLQNCSAFLASQDHFRCKRRNNDRNSNRNKDLV